MEGYLYILGGQEPAYWPVDGNGAALTAQPMSAWDFAGWILAVYAPLHGNHAFRYLFHCLPSSVIASIFLQASLQPQIQRPRGFKDKLYIVGSLALAGFTQVADADLVFDAGFWMAQEPVPFRSTCLVDAFSHLDFECEYLGDGPFSIQDALEALRPCGWTLRLPPLIGPGRYICFYKQHFTAVRVSQDLTSVWYNGTASIGSVPYF